MKTGFLVPVLLLVVVSAAGMPHASAEGYKGTFYGRLVDYECNPVTHGIDGIYEEDAVMSWSRGFRRQGRVRADIGPDGAFVLNWHDGADDLVTVFLGDRGDDEVNNRGRRIFEGKDYIALKTYNTPANPVYFYYDTAYAEKEIRRTTRSETRVFAARQLSPGDFNLRTAISLRHRPYERIDDYEIDVTRENGNTLLQLVAPNGGFILMDAPPAGDIALPTDGYRAVLEIALTDEKLDLPPQRHDFLFRGGRGRTYGHVAIIWQYLSIEQQISNATRYGKDVRAADDQVHVLIYEDWIVSHDEVRNFVYRPITEPILKAQKCGGSMPLTSDGHLVEFRDRRSPEPVTQSMREEAAGIRAAAEARREREATIEALTDKVTFSLSVPERLHEIALQFGDDKRVRLALLSNPDTASVTIAQLFTHIGTWEGEPYRFARHGNTPDTVLLNFCETIDKKLVSLAKSNLSASARPECKVKHEQARAEWKERVGR